MIERVRNWYDTNKGHLCDDKSLYSIVIETLDEKLSEVVFEKAIGNKEDVVAAYRRYEDLRECVRYYRSIIRESEHSDLL